MGWAIDPDTFCGYHIENYRAVRKPMPFTRGIGVPELIIILVIVMIIFGVGRLPEVGGALGKAIREFRKSETDKVDAPEDVEAEEQKRMSS